jgi:hypothetical protein
MSLSIIYIQAFPGTPQIKLSSNTVDFETVESSTMTSRTLLIQNIGTEDLKIFSLSQNGNYSVFDLYLEKKAISPGDSVPLYIIFDDIGFSGDLNDSICLETNDPNNPEISIHVHVKVKREVEIFPRRITFANIDRKMDQRTIILKNLQENKYIVYSVEVHSKALKAEITPLEKSTVIDVYLNRDNLNDDASEEEYNVIISLQGNEGAKKIILPVKILKK